MKKCVSRTFGDFVFDAAKLKSMLFEFFFDEIKVEEHAFQPGSIENEIAKRSRSLKKSQFER